MFQKIKDYLNFKTEEMRIAEPFEVLPPLFYNSRSLLFVWVIPQVIMLLINIFSWNIIKGDASDSNIENAYIVLTLIFLSVSIGLYVSLFSKRTFTVAKAFFCELFLMAYFDGYIFFVTQSFPENLSVWILSPFSLIFTAAMATFIPGLFVGIRFCAYKQRFSTAGEISIALLMAIVFPILFYAISVSGSVVLFSLFESFFALIPENIVIFCSMLVFALISFVTCLGIGRVLIFTYLSTFSITWACGNL